MSDADRNTNIGVFDARGDGLVIDAVTDLEHGAVLLSELSKTGVKVVCDNDGTEFAPYTSVGDMVEFIRRTNDAPPPARANKK